MLNKIKEFFYKELLFLDEEKNDFTTSIIGGTIVTIFSFMTKQIYLTVPLITFLSSPLSYLFIITIVLCESMFVLVGLKLARFINSKINRETRFHRLARLGE